MALKGGDGVRYGRLNMGGHISFIFNYKCEEAHYGKARIQKNKD
jgi:hypothetical protein